MGNGVYVEIHRIQANAAYGHTGFQIHVGPWAWDISLAHVAALLSPDDLQVALMMPEDTVKQLRLVGTVMPRESVT